MIRWCTIRAVLVLLTLSAGACDEKPSAKMPAPQEATAESVAQFCAMAVAEHPGPKGQIFLTGNQTPLWFASVHDAFAFTMLAETPKSIAAIYVNDMGKAKNWDHPEAGTWIDARQAIFVIRSGRHGGMGEDEAVPFSDEAAAHAFAHENGGALVRFAEMPKSYILPQGDGPLGEEVHPDHDHQGHDHQAHDRGSDPS